MITSSMEAMKDLDDDLEIDWGSLANELFSDNAGGDETAFDLHCPDQPNINMSTSNDGANIEGGLVNMGSMLSQYGVNEKKAAESNLTLNNSLATPSRSGQILTAATKLVSNPVAQSSRTMDLPQYNPLQPIQGPQNQSLIQHVLKQTNVQQPQTSSSDQCNIMFGHQKNLLHNPMPSDQLYPYQKPMVNMQTGHLHNQQVWRQQSNTSHLQQQHHRTVQSVQNFQQSPSQNQFHFQLPTGTSHNLISEGGPHRLQEMMIGKGQNNPQVLQENVANCLSDPVGFLTPAEFSNPTAWRGYAFRQIKIMKDRYFNELLTMKNNASQFHTQATNIEMANKYRNIEAFLEKLIAFLNTPTVDMLPKHDERVYNYMTFIVNYIKKYRDKHQDSSEQVDQQPAHHPPIIQSRGPQLRATGDMKLHQNPLPNIAQETTNLEANMVNFNQNFPSRRPQQERFTPSTSNSTSFQMGRIEQRPPIPSRIGSFKATQPNFLTTLQQTNVGPITTKVNVSGSPMGLLKSTTAVNFPSSPLSHKPMHPHSKFNSEKLKQPILKVNELTESKGGRTMSPLGSRLINQYHSPQFSMPSSTKPIIQHASSSKNFQRSVLSQQVNVNTVLSPETIARSSFLHASSATPSHHEKQHSSRLPSLSTTESRKSETPTTPCQCEDQKAIENQVPDMGAPTTPKTLPIDAPSKEKVQESQENPHLRLVEVMKSISSKGWSSLPDICTATDDPINHIGSYLQDKADFMLECDFEQEQNVNSMPIAGLTKPLLSNIEDESDFSLEHGKNLEQKVRRELMVTSANRSLPHSSDHDKVVSKELDIDSAETSKNKRPKIECNIKAILDEIEEINSKLLETSLNVLVDHVEDTAILGGHEGIIVRCLYQNICFPELFSPLQQGASYATKPEFIIDLLVQADYPKSTPTIFNSSRNVFSNELWVKLYEMIVSRFKNVVRVLPEQASLGELARQWDACAHSVIAEVAQRIGGASFSERYGSWENCIIGSSGSNDSSKNLKNLG